MEWPVSGRRQDTGERKKCFQDAALDRRHIRSGGLRFGGPVRQMHGTHGTQDIIFANVLRNTSLRNNLYRNLWYWARPDDNLS